MPFLPRAPRRLALLAAVLMAALLSAPTGRAQEAEALPSPVIAVIDIQEVLNKAKASRDIRTQRDTHLEEFKQEFARREEELRQRDQDLARQRSLLSSDAFAEKRREFENAVAEFQRGVQGRREALEVAYRRAMAKLQEQLYRVTDEIAQERGVNMVLAKSQVLLFDSDMEITDEALSRLDARVTTIEFPEPKDDPAGGTE